MERGAKAPRGGSLAGASHAREVVSHMSINRVNISGNLTRDPELRMTSGGTQVLSFGVAVNDRRRNPQTGDWEDYPNFVDCTMFGTRAEAVSRYLSKGSKVAIEGKLRYSSWERDSRARGTVTPLAPRPRAMASSPLRGLRRPSRPRRRYRTSTTTISRSRAWSNECAAGNRPR